MEITLQSYFVSAWCSPVTLLHISEHLFKDTNEGVLLFVCLNFDLFAFLLLHSFYVSCELSYFSIKSTVMQIEKTLTNGRLRVQKYPENFAFLLFIILQ